jgi:hypothetical protein
MRWKRFKILDNPACRSAPLTPVSVGPCLDFVTGFCDRKHGTTDGCDTVHNEFILINDLRPALRLLLEVYLIGVSEIDMGIISGLRSGQFGFRSSNMALPNKPIWESCPYINQ